jgi:hypothetical protein
MPSASACSPAGLIMNPLERTRESAQRFKFNGEWRTVREIAELTGLPVRTLYTRVKGDDVILTVHRHGAVPKMHAFRGQQLTACQIADRTGLSEKAVRSRLLGGRFIAYGEMEEFQRDPPINARFVVFKGRKQTVSAWARECGLPPVLVHNRLDYGWTIDRALTTPRGASRQAPKPPSQDPGVPLATPPAPSLPGGLSELSSAPRGPATHGPKIIHNQTLVSS